MVGVLEDKPQVGTLSQHKGVGIYHPALKLEPQMVKESVDTIFKDPQYRKRALEMKRSYEDYNPVERLDELIQERTKALEAL